MTRALQNIYALLRPLRLYTLTGDTLVDAELAAYDAGFAILARALDELWRESFIQTAQSYGLTLREQAMRLLLRPDDGIERRRRLLLYRLSVAPGDCNLSGLIGSIRAAGLNALIVENPQGKRLSIIENGYISSFEDLDTLKENVRPMLPAHLETDFIIGNYTWDQFDKSDITCDLFDAKNATWSKLDITGSDLEVN